MTAFHHMKLPITSYEASRERAFDDNGHAATMAQLTLHVQGGTPTSHNNPVKEVQVTFDKPPGGGGGQIGHIEESANKATVFATVPLAEFEIYLAILHDDQRSHVYCGTDVGASTLGFFNLATEGFPAPVEP